MIPKEDGLMSFTYSTSKIVSEFVVLMLLCISPVYMHNRGDSGKSGRFDHMLVNKSRDVDTWRVFGNVYRVPGSSSQLQP